MDSVLTVVVVGGRSKSIVRLSMLFDFIDERVIGSVRIILCDDVLFDIESADIQRTAVGGGI